MSEFEQFNPEREQKKEFDGGTFSIDFLSTSVDGFNLVTKDSKLRHEPGTPLPEAERIGVERRKEKKERRVGSGFAPKVGLRNVRQNGNNLEFDILPVTHPTYRAINKPTETKKSLEIAQPAGTACVMMTTEKDGSHRLILQYRSTKNFFYGGVPGASIAGFLDGELDKTAKENRGKLVPINTGTVKDNILTEMSEELGLEPNDLPAFRITGLAKDKVKIHDEFLLLGESTLSTQEIGAKAEKNAKAKKPDDEYDFGEKFFSIPATPEAIGKLLTQVKCPLPSTHAAAFVAAGYSMMIEQGGLQEAERWKKEIETAIKNNYRLIDEQVSTFWKSATEEQKAHSPQKPERNFEAYDPAYSPAEQGLPNLQSELVRIGLIDSED